jgi:hypothetical protein
MNENLLKKIYTIVLVAFPLLYIYASPISALSFGDLVLIFLDIIIIFKIIKERKSIKISKLSIIFLMFSVIQFLLLIAFFGDDYYKVIMPTLRIVLYISSVGFFGKNYIDIEFAKKVLIICTFISSLYLLLQLFILKCFHFYLPGTLSNLPKYDENLLIYENNMRANWQYSYRVRSLFLEPSHYAIYASLGLIVLINYKKFKYKNLFMAIIIISMILSGSSTAILMIPLIIFIHLILNFKTLVEKKLSKIILIAFIGLIGLCIYMNTDNYQKFYDRTFGSGGATTNRIENYSFIFNNNDESNDFKIFGHGIYKISEYIPSVPRIYYYYGYVGFILLIIILFYYLIRGSNYQRSILLGLCILCFASELLFSHFMLPYLTLLIENRNNAKN